MVSFLTHFSENDYLDFFQFKAYLSKSGKLNVFICLLLGAISLYNTIQTKEYFYLCFFVAFVLFVILNWCDDNKIIPKHYLKNLQKYDFKLFSSPQFISVNQSGVEFKTVTDEVNLPSIDSVYPFSVIFGIYETEKAFYLFISSAEVKFISKREMSKEIANDIAKILKTNCSNYRTINL